MDYKPIQEFEIDRNATFIEGVWDRIILWLKT